MARVQLGVTLGDAETSGLVAFLESLTGELPANFATIPTLPAVSVPPSRESGKESAR
jgi:cytochrome c peroxidase